jgi:hypothetical protein
MDRRAEHVGGDRIVAILRVGLADLVRARTFDRLPAGEPGPIGDLGDIPTEPALRLQGRSPRDKSRTIFEVM